MVRILKPTAGMSVPCSASRRTLVEVDQFDSGRRDADRCSRDGRAPHSNNHG